jgi:hypothetical protein
MPVFIYIYIFFKALTRTSTRLTVGLLSTMPRNSWTFLQPEFLFCMDNTNQTEIRRRWKHSLMTAVRVEIGLHAKSSLRFGHRVAAAGVNSSKASKLQASSFDVWCRCLISRWESLQTFLPPFLVPPSLILETDPDLKWPHAPLSSRQPIRPGIVHVSESCTCSSATSLYAMLLSLLRARAACSLLFCCSIFCHLLSKSLTIIWPNWYITALNNE